MLCIAFNCLLRCCCCVVVFPLYCVPCRSSWPCLCLRRLPVFTFVVCRFLIFLTLMINCLPLDFGFNNCCGPDLPSHAFHLFNLICNYVCLALPTECFSLCLSVQTMLSPLLFRVFAKCFFSFL